jgi:type II secretory pathway pseudopilin PulG
MELLAVLGIMAILTAILFPVISTARRDALRASSTSNLRQLAQAMALYEGSFGAYPIREHAEEALALANAPTCDPSDYWRGTCLDPYSPPRIGSYGYARSLSNYRVDANWSLSLAQNPNRILFVSIYYGSHRIEPFEGEEPPNLAQCFRMRSCVAPDRRIVSYLDTSAKTLYRPTIIDGATGTTGRIFTWRSALEDIRWERENGYTEPPEGMED